GHDQAFHVLRNLLDGVRYVQATSQQVALLSYLIYRDDLSPSAHAFPPMVLLLEGGEEHSFPRVLKEKVLDEEERYFLVFHTETHRIEVKPQKPTELFSFAWGEREGKSGLILIRSESDGT